jgi:hypothetical protein
VSGNGLFAQKAVEWYDLIGQIVRVEMGTERAGSLALRKSELRLGTW